VFSPPYGQGPNAHGAIPTIEPKITASSKKKTFTVRFGADSTHPAVLQGLNGPTGRVNRALNFLFAKKLSQKLNPVSILIFNFFYKLLPPFLYTRRTHVFLI
jgi:hypothetical protein